MKNLNSGYSWLIRLQALAIDAHFMVEQTSRGLRGYWFNFNGTAGVWRKAAIEDAGGWTADTLTEDLDLSYRAHLRGWRGQYLSDLVAPAEVPAHISGFRRQQHRWARGSLECAAKLLPSVWRSEQPLGVKFQASAHLLGYAVHLMLFTLTLLYPAVVALSLQYSGFSTLFGIAYVLALTSVAPALFFITGQSLLGRPWWRALPRVGALMVVGSGLMLNTVRAAIQMLLGHKTEFERTAKFGIEGTTESAGWMGQRYQLRLDPIVFGEMALGAYSLATVYFAFTTQTWGVFVYSLMFGVGLVVIATATIGQSIAVFRKRSIRSQRIRTERSRWATTSVE